jgi:hypothetical protein
MNSTLACLNAALQTDCKAVNYDYLMGISSHAFRLQFNWCPSAPHAQCGFDTFEPALRATGFESRTYPLAAWEADTRKQRKPTDVELKVARNAVMESIDAGIPVLCSSEECGVLAGYESVSADNPTGLLRRPGPLGPPPAHDAPYVDVLKELPWGVCVLRESGQEPDRRQSIIWSLRTGVCNARKSEQDSYAMGFAAWKVWIRELGDLRPIIGRSQQHLDKFDTDESAPFEIQLGNAWCYDSLIDARRCAAGYLRSVSGTLGGEASEHCEAAANSYDEVLAALMQGVDCPTRIAPYPWMEDQAWTQDRRNDQADRLRAALEHEETAIADLDRALGAAGVTEERF